MGQGYQKFRRRMLRAALWRSILPGASVALCTFAVLFVLYKRLVLSLPPLFGAAIGAVAGLLVGAVLFVLLYPYKKRLARKLDRELCLREGVQTMLAYRDREDDIMVLQRKQTEQKLQSIPTKKLKVKNVWTCLVCLVLAMGLTVTAFAIPAKIPAPPEPPVDPPFELSEWDVIALKNLIEEVKASTVTEPAKGETVTALESLLEALYKTETQSRMKTLVIDTAVDIRHSVAGVVSIRSFSPILSASGSSYTRALEQALGKADQTEFKAALDAIVAGINEDKEFDVAIHVLSEELRMAVRNAGVRQEDALYIELDRLSNTLANVADQLGSYTLTWGRMQVSDAFNVAYSEMGKAMTQQRYDGEMGDYVVDKLLSIFGISKDELPSDGTSSDEGPQTPGDYEDDDDDQSISDGGLGSGELIVGSQDVIYDPYKGEYVKYSEVIDIYNAIFLENKIDGVLSEEMAELIEKYFTALFSPSNKD